MKRTKHFVLLVALAVIAAMAFGVAAQETQDPPPPEAQVENPPPDNPPPSEEAALQAQQEAQQAQREAQQAQQEAQQAQQQAEQQQAQQQPQFQQAQQQFQQAQQQFQQAQQQFQAAQQALRQAQQQGAFPGFSNVVAVLFLEDFGEYSLNLDQLLADPPEVIRLLNPEPTPSVDVPLGLGYTEVSLDGCRNVRVYKLNAEGVLDIWPNVVCVNGQIYIQAGGTGHYILYQFRSLDAAVQAPLRIIACSAVGDFPEGFAGPGLYAGSGLGQPGATSIGPGRDLFVEVNGELCFNLAAIPPFGPENLAAEQLRQAQQQFEQAEQQFEQAEQQFRGAQQQFRAAEQQQAAQQQQQQQQQDQQQQPDQQQDQQDAEAIALFTAIGSPVPVGAEFIDLEFLDGFDTYFFDLDDELLLEGPFDILCPRIRVYKLSPEGVLDLWPSECVDGTLVVEAGGTGAYLFYLFDTLAGALAAPAAIVT